MLDLHPRRFLDHALAGVAQDGLVIDVGAADGEFAAEMRLRLPDCHLLLIEPTPSAAQVLAARYAIDPRTTVLTCALSDQIGTAHLNLYADATQNSLSPLRGQEGTTVTVTTDTLDAILARLSNLPPPIVLKVDTQGHDLAVLRGAIATIRHSKPLVHVEVIFANLYRGQCRPLDIYAELDRAGYTLADMPMPHTDETGRLAYADWVFTCRPSSDAPKNFFCRDPLLLSQQMAIYREAAAERLRLIERLDAECKARQDALDRLAKTPP